MHQNGNKQLLNNHQPVSLLPVCSKVFEKLIVDCIYNFLDQNSLLNASQSVFRSCHSFIYELIAITHTFFTAFDANLSLEVCRIFLNLFKAFNRVRHKDFLRRFRNKGIDDNHLGLIESFLHIRYKIVAPNGQFSSCQNINSVVPQGLV